MVESLVILVEGPSEKDFLRAIFPKILPTHITPVILVFQGKQDLEKQLVRKVRGWLHPNSVFLIMRDQDSGDCLVVKNRLLALCAEAGKPDAVVRIACRELESFFVGDWKAIADAYDKPSLSHRDRTAKYRNPDNLASPSQELKRVLPNYQKREGARRIAPYLDVHRNRSESFGALMASLTKFGAA